MNENCTSNAQWAQNFMKNQGNEFTEEKLLNLDFFNDVNITFRDENRINIVTYKYRRKTIFLAQNFKKYINLLVHYGVVVFHCAMLASMQKFCLM